MRELGLCGDITHGTGGEDEAWREGGKERSMSISALDVGREGGKEGGRKGRSKPYHARQDRCQQ